MIPHKKNPKKQLENYSRIFLQIGLVLVLFITHVIIENVISEKKVTIDWDADTYVDVFPIDPLPYERYKEPPKQVAVQQPKKVILDVIKKVKHVPKQAVVIHTPEVKPVTVSKGLSKKKEEKKKEEPKLERKTYPISMATPLFKGCKDISRKENRICFDRKMKKFVQRKFDVEIADGLNLSYGDYKIFVQFIINEVGDVVDIKVRAPHPKLQTEVEGMIKKLPQFTPGKVGDKAVKVKYILPINFKVD